MHFLQITSMLLSRHYAVTLIIVKPIVCTAESSHISSFLFQKLEVKHVDFQTIPFHHSNPIATIHSINIMLIFFIRHCLLYRLRSLPSLLTWPLLLVSPL